jgi:CheY-like chemotaxis protein
VPSGPFQIVVIEDNPADLHMIEIALRDAGLDCSVTAFAEGTAAMQHIDRSDSPVPQLIILDLNIPGMEGPSLLNHVRSNTRWTHIPVFIFTASRSPGDLARAKILGSDRYLIKPTNVDGFIGLGKQVKDWLEGHSKGRTDTAALIS